MPTLPTRAPKTVTIGTGSDVLTLKVCQDWYPSVDASYTVKIDGVQVGGTQTVSALHANGQWDTVHVQGNWTSASHTCTVTFLNNAGDGYDWITNNQPADFHDRNMYVYGAMINNKIITGANLNLMTGATGEVHTFNFTRAAPVVVPTKTPQNLTVGTGPDSLVLHAAQDWYPGANAQFTVSVDGTQIGGTIITQSLKSANQTDTITVLGNFASGNHTVSINFLNNAGDGYDWITFGEPANLHDRNLYISNVTFNGAAVSSSDLSLFTGGETHTFTITKASSGIPNNPPVSTTIGSGVNSIIMHVSQDWYNGNCQYTVAVDGTQIGGTLAASGIMAQGVFDTITVMGAFPAGGHSLTVTLLNDDWDGTWGPDGNTPNGHDRNLYVRSVTFNGAAVPSSDLDIMDDTPTGFSFQGATAGGGGGGGGGGDYPVALTNLGITNARKTFSDEFDTLSVSDAGPPTTTWSPWGHGLGDTMDVVNQYNLLTVSNSVVQMSYAEGGHRAILASSNGQNGNGFHQKYGYFEARMKLPTSDNIWGAFWLAADDATWSTSPDNYEIDVLEYFTQHINGLRNQYITSEVHDWFISPPGGQLVPSPLWFAQGYDSSSGGDMSADFHTYGMYWDPNLFIFFIDGVEMTRGVPPTQNVPPVYIIFDIEVNTGGSHPDQPVTYPASMYIDWVRVWQLPQF